MRLDRLRLVNVCQHKDTEVQFSPGVTGLFGPNGCGKSNLVGMAKVSLTGDFSVNPGVKTDNVRHGTGEDEKAFIEADWTHGPTSFTVQRGLAKTGNRLAIVGQADVIRKIPEINTTITNIIGLPRQVIDGFIFVDQWKMFEFMSAKPADRANTFAHLCNTFVAERIWKMLGEVRTIDQGMLNLPQFNAKELDDEISRTRLAISVAQGELSRLQKDVLRAAEGRRLRELVDGRRAAEAAREAVRAARRALKATKQAYAEKTAELERHNERLKAANVRLEAAEKSVGELQRRADLYEQGCRWKQEIVELARELEALREPLAPEAPDESSTDADLYAARSEAILILQAAQNSLDQLTADGVTACPTCATPIANIHGSIEAWQQTVRQHPAMIDSLTERINALADYREELREYEIQMDEYRRSRSRLQAEIDETTERLPPPGWFDPDVPDQLDYAKKLHQRAQALCPQPSETARLSREHSQLTGELSLRKKLLAEAEEKVENHPGTADETQVAAASEKLRLHSAAKSRADVLRERIANLESQLSAHTRNRDRYRQQQALAERAQVWLDDLQRWRSYLHRDCLPRIVAQHLLERLTVEVNNNLEDFANPFSVEAADDLSFVAIKPRGRREPAARLSGGEKIMLAVAFRLAVNKIFAADAGMMVLDEPSAGLDTHNIDCLADIFERISLIAEARKQQIILITHDDRLGRSIPNSIDLGVMMNGG